MVAQPAIQTKPGRPSRGQGSLSTRTFNFKSIAIDCVVMGFLALLPALFFWRLFTANPLDLASIPLSDFTDIHFPYREFLANSLASGDSLFWNPFVVAGHASLGDIQFQAFYPLGLLSEWLAGTAMNLQALESLVAVHLALAAVFTYLFVRQLVSGRLGPVVAALAFTYGGYLTSFPVQQEIILQVSVWLPAILLLLELALGKGRGECYVLAGIAAAMSILAGHPQTVAYVAVGAGLYGFYRLWDIGFSVKRAFGLVAVPLLAMGLASVQLLPSFQHLSLTTRTDVSFAFTSTGYSLKEVLGVIFPSQLGGRELYVGLLPLVLAGFALINSQGKRARVFWGVVAFVALLVSFGGNAFAQPALYATLPVLKFFRNHERAAFLFSFALAILAAYGVNDLTHVDRDKAVATARRLLGRLSWGTVAVFILAVVLLLANLLVPDSARQGFGQLTDRAFFTVVVLVGIIGVLGLIIHKEHGRWSITALMVGLIIFDLFSTNWQTNVQAAKPSEVYPQTEIVKVIQNDDSGLFRVSSEGLLPGGGNAGCIYGFQDLVGNSPLELDSFHQFDQAVPEVLRWQLLNVKYVVTKRQFNDNRFVLKAKTDDKYMYEIAENNRIPRAYVVTGATIVSSQKEALDKTKGIEPLRQVVLTENPGIPLPEKSSAPAQSKATITTYRNSEIQLDVSSSENGILVLSEVYYPGWEATIDGKPTPILQADYLLRGLPITAGEHKVKLTFSPPGLAMGTVITVISIMISLAALLAICLFNRKKATV